MDEGSAPALSIVRGSGPLQPSTILEVKQIPPPPPPDYNVDGSRESRDENSNLASNLGPQVPWPFLAFDPDADNDPQ